MQRPVLKSSAPRTPLALATALAALVLLAVAGRASAGPEDDAKKALAAKQYAQAAEVLAPVVEQGGGSREAALLFAQAVTKGRLVDHYTLAEDALSKQVKQSDDAALRTALGEVFLAQAPTRDDPKQVEGLYRDAIFQFEKALGVTPGHADALIGKAQAHYYMGESDTALEVLESLPADKPSARAQYWRGKVFYDRAEQAYKSDPKAEATKALFRKAKAASEASAKLEASYDAWMLYAYAAQYLGEPEVALEGYAKAMSADPESPYPLKGIRVLKTGDDAAYVATLEKLARDCPANVAVHLFLGEAHLKANRWEPAVKALSTYVQRSANPGRAHYLLGVALAKAGKESEAVASFELALQKMPQDLLAADELDQRLRAKYQETAAGSLDTAKACVAAYDRLCAMTRDNPFVFNSAGFLLRETYARHRNDAAWKPILEACVRFYEAGTKLIDDFTADVVEAASWSDRYGWAQITSDTALMYQPQFYPENADAPKAEAYYLRALKFSNNGYFDAWNNLRKMYHAQNEFQKVYDLDAAAAEGLALEDGTPHTTGRKAAREEMAKLVAEGKAKGE
jgi:tetratricopeptide (TPR) repeat protein